MRKYMYILKDFRVVFARVCAGAPCPEAVMIASSLALDSRGQGDASRHSKLMVFPLQLREKMLPRNAWP